jgi:hypothetical protein
VGLLTYHANRKDGSFQAWNSGHPTVLCSDRNARGGGRLRNERRPVEGRARGKLLLRSQHRDRIEPRRTQRRD